jgi:small subunit ribosomal protein S15
MNRKEIVCAFRQHDTDTGSCEVQIALLTDRIRYLTEHLKIHVKDLHSRRGLVALANKRRRLLGYLKADDAGSYKDVVQRLGLRK